MAELTCLIWIQCNQRSEEMTPKLRPLILGQGCLAAFPQSESCTINEGRRERHVWASSAHCPPGSLWPELHFPTRRTKVGASLVP